jgi:hypothetical protein
MQLIQKPDIVGARIVAVHETNELTEGGLDSRICYFTVDRGFTFTTPFAGEAWHAVEVPEQAKLLSDYNVYHAGASSSGWLGLKRLFARSGDFTDILPLIKKQPIRGVYCGLFDSELGFHHPSEGTIVFEDGAQLANNMVAPHGTGAAGLYYAAADSAQKTPDQQLVDFFSIPLDND